MAAVAAAALAVLAAEPARADRASMNMDPAWMYEKAGKHALAALYYHRTLRGLREMYVRFHWDDDPASNAAGKYATEYPQILREMADRYDKCLAAAALGDAERREMERLNYLWMTEIVDQEMGELRTACAHIAVACEDRGDFRMGQHMRHGEARFYRVVAAAFHERSAKEFEEAGQAELAAAHRSAVQACHRRAEQAERLAKGGEVLQAVAGLGGPERYLGDVRLHPNKPNPVAFQYIHLRLFTKDGQLRGPARDEVVASLRREGLPHADENVRLAAVMALSRLGDKESVRKALDDGSPAVRSAAAELLAATRWADGWAACHAHADAEVRAAVAPLLEAAGLDVLARTFVVSELVGAVGSAAPDTRTFCQAALERITARKLAGDQWGEWWKGLGNARTGLMRKAPDGAPERDETLDFGAWWQSLYCLGTNPLNRYSPPATVVWDGWLVVPKAGRYQLSVRNCGEGRNSRNTVQTPGRMGFPGLYLSGPSARVSLDGKWLITGEGEVVQDPCGGVRLDFGQPAELAAGLHPIRVEFDYRSQPTGMLRAEPSLRLYWQPPGRLREVVPAQYLLSKD